MSRPSTETPDRYELSTAIALFRYGLIAQLIHDPPPKGQQEAQLGALAAKTYQIPGSSRKRVSLSALRRYLKAYRARVIVYRVERQKKDLSIGKR